MLHVKDSSVRRHGWYLERVLFWLTILGSIFLALTLINYIWPFTSPDQPDARLRIGLIYDVSAFSFAFVAYSLFRAKWLRSCLVVVAIWALANASYGVGVLVFEPLSAWSIGLFLGELFVSSVLIYFAALEFRGLHPAPRPTNRNHRTRNGAF